MEHKGLKPIHKFNNGNGATLCIKCNVIICNGLTKDLFCSKCLEIIKDKKEEYVRV